MIKIPAIPGRRSRHGFVMPGLAIFLIGLFTFVALAVDIGMIAVARTQCQNAADVAALAGCRNLNNKPGSIDNNRTSALATAASAVTNNKLLNVSFTTTDVTSRTAGIYEYKPTPKIFLPSFPAAPPAGQSWTAMKVEVKVNQPTFFAKVLGMPTMPTGATATAVYRPRDVAFALDMTGSMAFASTTNSSASTGYVGSMDSNTLVPSFGHYINEQAQLIASADRSDSDGQAFSRVNATITTPNGPPIIRNFYFDPSNIASPATSVGTVTLITDTSDPTNPRQRPESNAFHRSNVTESSAGTPSTFTGPTYNFSGYNPNANSATEGTTPAPDWYGSQIDNGLQLYPGDRFRRRDGRIYKTSTSWSSTTTRAAGTAAELLGYGVTTNAGITFIQFDGSTTYTASTAANTDRFRDPVWEARGYDLDIAAYRAWRVSSNGNRPGASGAAYSTLLPVADQFKGFSMGPGYWGKTFYIWPPDPRPANDWRKKFFTTWTNAAPSATNINNSLLRTTADSHLLNTGTSPNYSAILSWIKSGPQTLPSNLRAGRVVYYTSIPNDTNTGSGTPAERLDKAFWREYIDWVLANGYTSSSYLYGPGDSWASATTRIFTGTMTTWTGPTSTWTSAFPHMAYSDSPNRPRLHMWFGPLSMLDFISRAGGSGDNWRPGTCYEAQCWQLKAAMNSVIDDVRNNHPNDTVGMAMFSYPNHSEIRTPMSQNYTAHKNALFYPKSLLTAINGGNTTAEFRPYNTNFGGYVNNEIPNSDGSTDPNTGLALAFNLLSPSATLNTTTYGTVKGRRGASKLVIFETDGVPNAYRTLTLNRAGYDTYYTIGATAGSPGNGNTTVMNEAYAVVQQMVKTMSTGNANGVDSGLSLPSAPCKVYSIGFGDLFDPVLAPSATFRPTALQFLANIQVYGGTSATGATTIPTTQIITGQYQTRIDTLKTCMERIFSSGVTVSLIE